MQNEDESTRDYFHRIDPLRVENAEEAELAFRLQNSTTGDPDLLRMLIERYSGDLFRWAWAYTYYQNRSDPSKEEILSILQQTFTFAITHTDQFHGQVSLFNWLFSISYQIARKKTFKNRLIRSIREVNLTRVPITVEKAVTWESLELIPEKLQTPFILRYLFHLGVGDISNILDLNIDEIHKRLVGGRKHLIAEAGVPGMDKVIQAYIDGFYDEEPEELSLVVEHLETCAECQTFMREINAFEKSLADSLQSHWTTISLDQKEGGELNKLVLASIPQAGSKRQLKINIRQVAWMMGLLAMFGILAIVFVRLTPSEREFPQADATLTPQLPSILNMQPVWTSSQAESESTQSPQFIIPAISSDGRWVVYTSINTNVDSQGQASLAIHLYDRQNGTHQVISDNKTSANQRWSSWVLGPSISGDGQRIVYVSDTKENPGIGYQCITRFWQACSDIFLYDQATKTTKRITQAIYGGAADGNSLAPTISEDGNWVAFWSEADNLADVNRNTCPSSPAIRTCLYLYLYEVAAEKLEQIPLRRVLGNENNIIDRISLSANGRFVGFTALPSMQPIDVPSSAPTTTVQAENKASQTNQLSNLPIIEQVSEAVVYDQQTGTFELDNRSQVGTAGNSPSSSPVLSADGRYVAFVSSASNLVEGDNNHASDVFVRDRQTGAVELASISYDGQQGNMDSGSMDSYRGYFGINLSSDGRYVVFQSMADNLSPGQNPVESDDCLQGWSLPCGNIYVHDRQTGRTDLVESDAGQAFSLFPEISTDGRWVSFSQVRYDCTSLHDPCANAILYDRQNTWVSNLTKFTQASLNMPWTYSSTLSLPWQSWESRGLAFSPDGRYLAVGGFDAKIRIWDLQAGTIRIDQSNPDAMIETGGNVLSTTLAYSQDSRWLAAGTKDGRVFIWQMPDGRLLYTLGNQADPIDKIVFSRDGTHLFISTLRELWMWSIGENELIKEAEISYGESLIYALDISPNGDVLATGRADGSVWLQSLPSGKLIGRLGGQQVTVSELAFSPDGSLLATRSAEAKINVWQITIPEAGTPSFTLRTTIASDAYVGNLVLSPDNKYLASTGSVAEITLWGVPDGKNYSLKPSIPDEMLYAVAFSKTSNVLATMFENEIQFWGLTPSYKSQYYTRATQDTFVDTPPLPISTAGDIEKLNQVSIGGMLSLDQAASQLQFPLLVPHRLPESLGYLGATVNPDGSVWLRYVDYHQQSFEAILYVYEKIIGNSAPPTMTVGASALILPLQIATEMGSISADYVQGDWKWSFGFTPPQEGMNTAQSLETWRWDSQSASQRLRWQQAGIFIAMYYLANDTSIHILTNPGQDSSPQRLSSFLNREDLLQIASGMQWYDRADTGFACYVSSGRLLYRISDNIEYTGERMCIKPELVVRRYKQQYISS